MWPQVANFSAPASPLDFRHPSGWIHLTEFTTAAVEEGSDTNDYRDTRMFQLLTFVP